MMRSAVLNWLEAPRTATYVMALALVLAAPSISVGLIADDFFQKLVLTSRGSLEAIPDDPMALFGWADGDPARAQAMMEVGMTGWWTDPHMTMTFLRPVTTITHYLDYKLWPESPELMHVHSLAWFALAMFFAARLFGELAAPGRRWLAVLALWIFALDDAHGMTLAWIANRNAIVAVAIGIPVLWLHVRSAKQDRWNLLGAVLLPVSLLAAEAAVAITAYLFAYAMCADPRGRTRGSRALLPLMLTGGLWAAAYAAGGYGAHGSGLVADPIREPLRFLPVLAERLPVLLAAQLAVPPSDPWEFYRVIADWMPMFVMAFCVAAILAIFLAGRPTLKANANARFWALGTLLAAVPVCAQFPHDRLLMFTSLGSAGLMAELIGHVWLKPVGTPHMARRVVIMGLAVIHLVLAPALLPLRVRAPADVAKMIAVADNSIDSDRGVVTRTVVLVNPPVDAYAGYIPPMREATGRRRPARLRWLATGASPLTLTRTNTHTLLVRPRDGFLSLPSERMQRRRPFKVGDTIGMSDMTVVVREITPDGRPALAEIVFVAPLEDPSLRFRHWKPQGFVPFIPPPVGESVVLEEADFLSMLP